DDSGEGGRIDDSGDVRGLLVGVIGNEGVKGILPASAIHGLDAVHVIRGKGSFDSTIIGVHDGAPGSTVIQSQGVAELVHGNRFKVIGRADVQGLFGVEIDVAGDGVIVGGVRHETDPQVVGREGVT